MNGGDRVHRHREREDRVVVDEVQQPRHDRQATSRVAAFRRPQPDDEDRNGQEQGRQIGTARLLRPVGCIDVETGYDEAAQGGDRSQACGDQRRVGSGARAWDTLCFGFVA